MESQVVHEDQIQQEAEDEESKSNKQVPLFKLLEFIIVIYKSIQLISEFNELIKSTVIKFIMSLR